MQLRAAALRFFTPPLFTHSPPLVFVSPVLPLAWCPAADLKKVQEIFLTERDAPPISWNMPPIAGALYWCRGLKERLVEPMAKIRQLNKDIMSREEAKEVLKVRSHDTCFTLSFPFPCSVPTAAH